MEAEDIVINEQQEIQAMLGNNPGCWVTFSIPALLALFVVLIGMSWYVQYPDIVVVPVTITSERPPVRLLARSAGKLTRLKVRDGDQVAAGQELAELESGAEGKDVAVLKSLLSQLEAANSPEALQTLVWPEGLRLGQMQNAFASLVNAHRNLQIQLRQDIVSRQILAIDNEIRETRDLIASMERQQDMLRQDLTLTEKDLDRQQQLAQQGLISAQDMEKTNSNFLRQKQQLEGFVANTSSQRVKIRQLETEQSQLSQGRRQDLLTKWETIRQIGLGLRGEINQWELLYLVKAPVAGRIALSQPLSEQAFIRADQELFSIVSPGADSGILALGTLPQVNSGKVGTGQKVNIRLDGFPYQEYGVLEGKILSVASVPTDGSYLLQISLPPDMQTSSHEIIPFKPEMRGSGHIITQSRTLLQRVFQQLTSLRN